MSIYNDMSTNDLINYYNKNIRRANDRLRNLEKLNNEDGFKGVTDFQYRLTSRELGNNNRFTKLPKNATHFQAIRNVNILNEFLDSPTTTKSGIVSIYKKRTDWASEKIGKKITWQEYAKFFESGLAKKLFEQFGSTQTYETIGRILKNNKKIEKEFDESKNIIYSEDDLEAILEKEMMDDYGEEIRKLFYKQNIQKK